MQEIRTPEELRALDIMVAEQVLSHHIIRQKKGGLKERTRDGHIRPLRAYSKDINAAWEIVERRAITLIPVENGQWFALVGIGERWKNPADFLKYMAKGDFAEGGAAVGQSAPETICLAALSDLQKRKAVEPPPAPENPSIH